MKEGEQVKQEAIASELGVSRIPVREALQQLEAEGLITLVSHKGAEVTRLEPEEIEELFDVRGMLECWLFEKALPHLSEADLTEAEEAVAAMRDANDFQSWSSQNWRFHEILYRLSHKRATLKIVKRVHHNVDRYVRLLIAAKPAALERIYQDYEELIRICRRHDAHEACALLARHIACIREDLLVCIRSD